MQLPLFSKAYHTGICFIISVLCLFANLLNAQCTTFGNFPPSYTTSNNFQANYFFGVTYTLNTSGYLTGLALKGNNTGSGIQMAIYANNSGTASNLVAYTATSTVGNGNIVLPVLTPTMIPAGVYWIMANYQTNAGHVSHAFGSTVLKPACFRAIPFGTTPPTTTTWNTTTAVDIDYWAEINTINVSASPSICVGTPITLTASAANPSASTTYSWSTGSTATAINVSPSVTTIYTLSTVSNSCASSRTVQVVVNPLPTLSFNNSATGVCYGQSATLSVSGAQSYFWYPGPLMGPTIIVTPTAPAQFTVFGFSAYGCASTATTNLGLSSQPTVVASNGTGTVCPESPVSLSASGATSYSWYPSLGPLTGAVVSVSPAISTIYTVVGTNGGCPGTTTVSVLVTAGPGMTVTSTNSGICIGNSATLTVNAPSSLGFTWSPTPSNSSVIAVTPSTTTVYSVTGINSLGCRSTYTIDQIVNPIPTISLSAASPSVCPGKSVTLTAYGANSYLWQQGNLTGSAVAVSPSVNTVYTVNGTSNGCTGVAYSSVTIGSPATIIATAFPDTVCYGSTVTFSVSGAPSFSWRAPSGVTFSGNHVFHFPSASGIFSVSGTGANGCTGSTTLQVNVVQPPPLSVSASPSAICSGNSATLSVTGASSYSWITGGSTASSIIVSPTTTSTYSISGYNMLGCASTKTLSLTVNPVPTVSTTISPSLICAGNSVYTLSANGANSYTWIPPSGSPVTGSSFTTHLQTATLASYTVIGSSLSCSSTSVRNVSVNASPTVTATSAATSICAWASVGLTASGASSYTWSKAGGGQVLGTGSVMVANSPGMYIAYGRDGLGCTGTGSVLIHGAVSPTISVASSSSSICASGSVTVSASGASTYTWMPMSTSGNTIVLNPTATSIYTVVGTGTSGCTGTATLAVNVNPTPTVQIVPSTNSICAGGSVTLTANGATTYTWLPSSSTGSSTVMTPSTTSTFTVIGAINECTAEISINVPVSANPVVTLVVSSPSLCSGQSATLTASGAASYSWSSSGTSFSTSVSPSVSSVFTVTGISSLGCIGTQTVDIQVNATPTLTINSPGQVCSGQGATLSALGAVSYTWLPTGFIGNTFTTNLSSGTSYTVIGENTAGCTKSMVTSLITTPTPTISVTPGSATVCSGANALLTASGANSYTWSPGNLAGASVAVSPLANQIYTVIGMSGACVDSETISIEVGSPPSITAWSTDTAICRGNLTKLNATGAPSYTWLPGGTFGSVVFVTPNVSTTYTVMGGSLSCQSTQTIAVIVIAPPTLSVTTSNSDACIGDMVVLRGQGANTYTWSSGSLTDTAMVMPSVTTLYTLSGSNLQGCSSQVVISQKVGECLGMNGGEINDLIKVFPNPTNGLLQVGFNGVNSQVTARLLNSLGQVIITKRGTGSVELDLEGLANGCYFLTVEKKGTRIAVQPIIKN